MSKDMAAFSLLNVHGMSGLLVSRIFDICAWDINGPAKHTAEG
jgi:hypothetical protein